jgi:Double zinc ribbon
MAVCTKCGLENAAGSKFCAGCGTALPVNLRCASCGTESPAGSKFCKKCGAVLQGSAQAPQRIIPPTGGPAGVSRTSAGAPARPGALSENLSKVKIILWVCVGLYAAGIYLNYSTLSKLQAYLGQFADTSTSWFLIILDVALGGLSVYAVFELGKGKTKLAKAATIANAILGAIALLLYFKGGIISILLNGGLLAGGVWGRLLISKEERPLV